MKEVFIREEAPADEQVIFEVTEIAFRDLAISDHTEQFMIAALRKAGALTISLVAEGPGAWWGTSPSRR